MAALAVTAEVDLAEAAEAQEVDLAEEAEALAEAELAVGGSCFKIRRRI